MFKILLEFFSVNKKISIPEVGTLSIENTAAEDNFGNKTIIPAKPVINFYAKEDNITTTLFEKFAQNNYNKSIEELTKFYKAIAYTLQKEKQLNIDGLGILKKEEDKISFRQFFSAEQYFSSISVEKVIRQDAEHTLTVGEHQKTSSQMREVLAKNETKKYWWVYVLIALLICGAGYFFYKFYFLSN